MARTPSSSGKKKPAASSSSSSPSKSNGRKSAHAHDEHGFEFGGPVGALFIPALLIVTIYFLQAAANKDYKLTLSNFAQVFDEAKKLDVRLPKWKPFAAVVAWFLFQVVLERVLPGDVAEGTLLRNGQRLKYNINGHLAFWVSLIFMGHGRAPAFNDDFSFRGFEPFDLEWIYDNYLDLSTSAIIFSTALSVYLYAKSFAPKALLALGGDSGVAVYDWFIGRELNPREGDFDWKCFCELRPGLIGWVVINLGCLVRQYQIQGYASTPMILVNLFHGLYVWDALYSERAILTTMDITTDGFGFMLAFGDLAWVPFTYSLQARFLVHNTPDLPLAFWAFVFSVQVLGLLIFRGANGQKDQFRRDPTDPSVKHIKTIDTKRGTKLMVTGWWGLARKINYTGDWLQGLAWCLTTGFMTPVTYFYSIYFAILLIHRAWRDDEACLRKYGEEDWARYKKAVPYIFVPGVI